MSLSNIREVSVECPLGYSMGASPSKKMRSRVHLTGCARTEGFYKQAMKEENSDTFLVKNKLCVKKSPIHGWGVFARETVETGETVIEYTGEIVRYIVADNRQLSYSLAPGFSNYMFEMDENVFIDATRKGNISRFINHNCDPNCFAELIDDEDRQKICIFAKKTIGVNEELTFDYNFLETEEKIPCMCGALQCRGFMN